MYCIRNSKMSRISLLVVAFMCFAASNDRFVNALEACCGDLGCFSSDRPFFHLLYRPFLNVPNCAIVPRLRLHLNTRENPVETQILDPNTIPTIIQSNLLASRETKILIHGHTDNYNWAWWEDIRSELLLEGDFNVIRVDWSAGNNPPYIQAIANSRLVGAFVAKLIAIMRDHHGFDVAKIHVIGHSLGAQTAGYVGKLTPNLGRITGLDPAGPGFTYMATEVRLDPTDAVVVDTLVTDGVPPFRWGFGSSQAMGHLNFYPNGGTDQPGCDEGILDPFINGVHQNTSSFGFMDMFIASSYQAISCSHIKALTIFHQTISTHKCSMKAFQCDSYDQFQEGNCFNCDDDKCSVIGLHADVALAEPLVTKKFYLKSAVAPPFCAASYKVQFKLQEKDSTNNARSERGQLFIQLFGELGTSDILALTAQGVDFQPGQSFTQMISVPSANPLGNIESLVFRWQSKPNVLSPIDWIRRKYLHIDGDLAVTSEAGARDLLRPGRVRVEDGQDLSAIVVRA